MPTFHDCGDNIRGKIADPYHVSQAPPTLAQPGGDLRQRSSLFEHGLSHRMGLGDQPDQPAVPIGCIRLRTREDQLHDLPTAHALYREAEMVEGIFSGSQCRQAKRDINMLVMQIDALDNILQHRTLACANPLAQRNCCCSGSLDRAFNLRAVVGVDRTVDRTAISQEAAQLVEHHLFKVMGRNPPRRLAAIDALLVMGNIVAIPLALLVGMAWRHPPPQTIVEQPHQQTGAT